MQRQLSGPIACLIAAHVVSGAVAATFSADVPGISSAIFISLVFCQASLLGIWGGLGLTHWLLRCVGVVAGTVLLWIVLGLGIKEMDGATLLLVSVAVAVVTLVTWMVRLLKARLGKMGDDAKTSREGLRFHIRHLLGLTFAVACLVSLGKLLAPYLDGMDIGAKIVVLGLCFVAVALAALWAMLGLARPTLRVVPVLAIAGGSGWVAAFAMAHSGYAFWIALTVLQAVYLLVSLGVVRISGYRLLEHG